MAGEAGTSVAQRVLVLVILALVQFTSIVDFMVIMPLGPIMMRKLGLDTRQFSLVVSSYSISAGLAGLLASSIMDRFGRKTAYLSLFAGFLLGTLACGLARNYATLLAAKGARRRLRGNSGWFRANDHRGRFSGRTARPRDRCPDVGLCARTGIRGSRRLATRRDV